MAKRIIGIILVIAALGTVLLGVKAGGSAPENRKIIESATVVSDGKVLPENEGKIVIVPGTLEADLPFVDEETGITIHSIVAWRHVQKLRVGEDKEKKTQYWVWDFEYGPDSFGGDKKLVAPNVTLGEFAVSEEFIQTLSTNQKRTEFTENELNQMDWNVFKDAGKYYLYQGEKMPKAEGDVEYFNTKHSKYAYKDYIGTLRVNYEERDGELDYTIVGLQQNGQLVKAPELGVRFVCPGQLTVSELLEQADSDAKSSTIMAFAFAAVLLAVGVFAFVKKEKKVS